MYKPNFCSECGAKILRMQWYPWTSRRFCSSCSQRMRKERLTIPIVVSVILFGVGLGIGRAAKSPNPPLIIERSAAVAPANVGYAPKTEPTPDHPNMIDSAQPPNESQKMMPTGNVYVCGARTKKGKPCSRRLPEAVRCWQHKGMRPMLPPEKLIVNDQ